MTYSQATPFRALLCVAAIAASGLLAEPARAQLLGGGSATGSLGGTLSPRQLDVNGQLRAKAPLPRAEQLRETAGQATAQARGNVDATADTAVKAQGAAIERAAKVQAMAVDKAVKVQGVAAEKAAQVQGTVSGSASATAKEAAGEAGQAGKAVSASGSMTVKPQDGGVDASASGQARASR